jgi:hypothetical protein
MPISDPQFIWQTKGRGHIGRQQAAREGGKYSVYRNAATGYFRK